jgi:hypothetical protein
MIRMIVFPGVRRAGANAAGASASGRTAPMCGLSRPCGMHPHDDIVRGGLRVRHVRQGESTDTGVTVSDSDGSHGRILVRRLLAAETG